jgi:hypothetical protein
MRTGFFFSKSVIDCEKKNIAQFASGDCVYGGLQTYVSIQRMSVIDSVNYSVVYSMIQRDTHVDRQMEP